MYDPIPSVPAQQLADPAFRRKLLCKVEALISVLEVARSKVDENLEAEPNEDVRLRKVMMNLEHTLSVCHRARRILLHAEDTKPLPSHSRNQLQLKMTFRDYVEVMSFAEYCRFRTLGPVTPNEIHSTDLEELCDLLVRGEAA
ncbi:MAG: hypothetical protein QGH51_02570 [Planctomycetota bacterium]|jgi:hypothetical protein|nr:hypothetical protein [Planctomycetota bacterium]MDP6940887.1 hypothetical protein [Planctomycetota bacterium]